MHEWTNWSGSLKFNVSQFYKPASEEELQQLVRDCYINGKKLKLAAAGHSSSPLVQTPDTLVHLHHFKKLQHVDAEKQTVTFQSGITVHEANSELQKLTLALFNTGDVDVQTLAGAIATGTHGTGKYLQNLASILDGVRMIDYQGDIKIFTQQQHPDVMRAMRVSLGALGIFTEITVKVKPLFKLQRVELCTDVETCLENFDELARENRNMDFYWYPRSDEVKIRILNEPGKGMRHYNFRYTCNDREEGWVGEILPRKRDLKFDETEYALPAENGIACFLDIRKRIKEKHRKEVAWRVLVRTIAADDNYLSPHHGRESIAISVHHNAGLPFDELFKDLEPIFRAYNGRPHWAKKHFQSARHLAPLYPEWDKFQQIRKQLDPEGFFMNDHLRNLLNNNVHE
jgi:FAD/FMN-containing dehydrogenase